MRGFDVSCATRVLFVAVSRDGASGVRQTESAPSAPAEHQRQSQSHPRRPFTVHAFEIRSLSRSCSTAFKYFRRVRCGAITRLLERHRFTHQAGDGHISALLYLLRVFAAEQKMCADDLPQNYLEPVEQQQTGDTAHHFFWPTILGETKRVCPGFVFDA